MNWVCYGLTIISSDILTSIEDVIGSQFNDALVGSAGDNYIDGNGANGSNRLRIKNGIPSPAGVGCFPNAASD